MKMYLYIFMDPTGVFEKAFYAETEDIARAQYEENYLVPPTKLIRRQNW